MIAPDSVPVCATTAYARRLLFLVFTLSGFAGLIYESIWSHYLKLMLGHAAHAQTLVLVLFMGGMALGAWLCGRASTRVRYPLLAYAAVELTLGVFAFGFDQVFRAAQDWLLNTAAPALAQPFAIEALKWSLATLLILPACVLLGATFPLISAGILRLEPSAAGNTLGWLYFTNSLGAVVGVLSSGFVLVSLVGLPGTLMTAGLCNFLLAIVVYGVAKRIDTPPLLVSAMPYQAAASSALPSVNLLLFTAFLTGAASFLYEIGWIRMLSLVLGSATHSFELMLGAFILGLALGALWIRDRVDRVTNPLRTLAWVQLCMGVAALGTLVVYGWSFGWMAAIVQTLAKSETGYSAFNLSSQLICLALMLPVTFFAGTTLPIITALVLRTSAGESAIGKVYSANTWGAIVGIVVAVNVAMPYLGLRNVVVLGAAIDILLGLWLFSRAGIPGNSVGRLALVALLMGGLGIAALARFDPTMLASGVFRSGIVENRVPSIWRRDGKTASIDVSRDPKTGLTSIKTNGKPDASLSPTRVTEDDYTMVLLGALPLAFVPQAKEVAVIGLGSGRSTHVFLGAPDVERVDTIEIEPAMVEGARLFGDMVARTFNDPRSFIHIEDAKTFFARHQKRYDLIMSEPSNPWVSGVASLFSQEFYRQIKSHLTAEGVFVQWLQLYEFDDALFGSVLKALGSEFEDYAIYAADDGDFVIVAKPVGTLGEPDFAAMQLPGIAPMAIATGLRQPEDLKIRRMGRKKTIDPFVQSMSAPANSDYFPFLDQYAAKYRFLGRSAEGLTLAHPVTHRLEDSVIDYTAVSPVGPLSLTAHSSLAFQFWALMDWKHIELSKGVPPQVSSDVFDLVSRVNLIITSCGANEVEQLWKPAMYRLGAVSWPYMEAGRAAQVISFLRKNVCEGETAAQVNALLEWMDAIARRDWNMVSAQAVSVLSAESQPNLPAFLVRETLLADYLSVGPAAVNKRTAELHKRFVMDRSIQYLIAISEH